MSLYICTSPGFSQAIIPSRVRQASHNLIFFSAVAQSAQSFHNLGSLSQLSETLFLIVDCLNHCQLSHMFYIIYQKIQFAKESEQWCGQPIDLKCPQNMLRSSHPPLELKFLCRSINDVTDFCVDEGPSRCFPVESLLM